MLRATETLFVPGGTIEKGAEVPDDHESVAGREHLFEPVLEAKTGRGRRSQQGDSTEA